MFILRLLLHAKVLWCRLVFSFDGLMIRSRSAFCQRLSVFGDERKETLDLQTKSCTTGARKPRVSTFVECAVPEGGSRSQACRLCSRAMWWFDDRVKGPAVSATTAAVDVGLAVAVRLCRVVNGMLRHMPAWWWIVRVRVALLTLQQPFLRYAALWQLELLPPTGLYGEEVDAEQFGRFCTHAFEMFRLSPRTRLLRELCLKLGEVRANVTEAEWLMHDILGMSQASNATEDEVKWCPTTFSSSPFPFPCAFSPFRISDGRGLVNRLSMRTISSRWRVGSRPTRGRHCTQNTQS